SRHTDRLIRGAVKMDLFGKATNPRLFTELQHIFAEENPILAIRRLADFNLFQLLWPDLLPNLKTDRRFLHILRQAQSAISWFHLLYLEETIEPWRIYLLAIMARSRPKQLETFCERFQIRTRICQELITQKLTADDIGNRFYHRVPKKNSELRRMLAPLSNDGLLYLMAIARRKEIKQVVSLYVTSLRNIKPLLNGEDLKQLGYTPGEKFKKIFSALRDAQLDSTVKSREDEEALVLKQFPL
ncbi:MAG TPA: prohead protease, partial [Desulfocapsa sulfexigens]|nr:prohead protease [Desulfocapsa sulfexigens]